MNAETPTPHLPRGAGGPPRRAAGRGSPGRPGSSEAEASADRVGCHALVLDADPLARLLVAPAVEALGLRVGDVGATILAANPASSAASLGASSGGHVAVFLPLSGQSDCLRSCAAARASAGHHAAPLVVGYGTGSPALLAAHRAHGCADVVLLLVATAGGPRFAHLPGPDPVTQAGLTRREADVLVLLLDGLTTPAVAVRLGVSTSTARSHCRAVLRKFGAGDRSALRALLLAGFAGPARAPVAGPLAVLPEGALARSSAPPSNFA